MPQFFFPIDYHGSSYADDIGEMLASSRDAQVYAGKVANELGRNSLKAVVVSVIDQKGALLSKVSSNRTESKRAWPDWSLKRERRKS
jgi:hypothetical protein